ncbi:unnamed protein product, partial [Closterium sp. NIES-54]
MAPPSQGSQGSQGLDRDRSRGVGVAGGERILAAAGLPVPAAAPSSFGAVGSILTAGETGGNQTAAGNHHGMVTEAPGSVLPFLGFNRSSLHAPRFLRPPKLLSLSLMPGGGGAAGKEGRGKEEARGKEGRGKEEVGKEEGTLKEEGVKQKQKGKGKRVGFGAVECVAGPPASALSSMWRAEERWEEESREGERGEDERVEEDGTSGKENRGVRRASVSGVECVAGPPASALAGIWREEERHEEGESRY